MRSVAALAVLVTLVAGAAATLGGPASDAVRPEAGVAQAAPAGQVAALGPLVGDEDEVGMLITPGDSFDLAFRSSGEPVEVVVRLYNGASLGGVLSAPGLCQRQEFTTHVIGMSTSGQVLAWGQCGPIPAGIHSLHIEGGGSAFVGSVQLLNATFVAP